MLLAADREEASGGVVHWLYDDGRGREEGRAPLGEGHGDDRDTVVCGVDGCEWPRTVARGDRGHCEIWSAAVINAVIGCAFGVVATAAAHGFMWSLFAYMGRNETGWDWKLRRF